MKTKQEIKKRINLLRGMRNRMALAKNRRDTTTKINALNWVIDEKEE